MAPQLEVEIAWWAAFRRAGRMMGGGYYYPVLRVVPGLHAGLSIFSPSGCTKLQQNFCIRLTKKIPPAWPPEGAY